MGDAVTLLSKGDLINKIDAYLEKPTPKKLADLLPDDQDKLTSLFNIGLASAIVEEDERHHCEEEFLGNGNKAYWPNVADKAEHMRAIYVEALRLAMANQKPIVTLWLRGLRDEHFELYLEETPREVHVIWVTGGKFEKQPGMLESAPAKAQTFVQDLWIVGPAAQIAEVWERYPKTEAYEGFTGPEDLEGFPGMQRLNIPGY